jgi:hypothetical protein
MRYLRNGWNRRALIFCGAIAAVLSPVRHGLAQSEGADASQEVIAEAVPNNPAPLRNDAITVAINVDVSALQVPNNRLGAYQATLAWDPAVIQYLNFTPAPPPWNTPDVAESNVAAGRLEWNDFVTDGSTGKINILNVNFMVIGAAGTSTNLDLGFSEMITATTFRDLLGLLKINDGKIQVGAANNAPVLNPIADQTMDEGMTLNIPISATDADGDKLALAGRNLPTFGSFVDNGDGTGTISFAPGFDAAGVYQNIQVIAADNGTPALSDTISFALTVRNVNRAPALSAVADQTMDEGTTLNIPVSATDADGDKLALAGRNLPTFGSFVDNGNGTGTISFAPGFDAAGVYPNIQVIAADNGTPALSDTISFALTVRNVNRAPALSSIADQTMNEGTTLNVSVSATDADGDKLALAGKNLPTFGSFIDNGNGTGTISFAPGFDAAGVYPNIQVIAADNGTPALSDTLSFALTVVDVTSQLVCHVEIVSPQDESSVCGDSLEVCISTKVSGGVAPIAKACEVNGIPVRDSCAKIPFANEIIAKCTFTDNLGNTATCRDTIHVVRDNTRPRCVLTMGSTFIKGKFYDNESGIASVVPEFLSNGIFTVTPFQPGDKVVSFQVNAVNPDEAIGFIVRATDLCGNAFRCDPVFLSIFADQEGRQYALTFPAADRYFNVTNQGLTEIRAQLNGREFKFFSDPARAERELNAYFMPVAGAVTIDLSRYLREGENRMVVTCAGPPGTGADLLLVDQATEIDYTLELQTLPVEFQLSQNYPNPFNPTTNIQYSIPAHLIEGVNVQIRIYNTLGELVRTLVEERKSPGQYATEWDGKTDNGASVSSGVYIYQLMAGEFKQTKRMTVLK